MLSMHPADVTGARQIALLLGDVSAVCSSLRGQMPVLIDAPLFDWQHLNTDVLVHIFKYTGNPKLMGRLCRRFYGVYLDRFVRRMVIPSNTISLHDCFQFALAPLTNIDVEIKTPCMQAQLALIHKFLTLRHYNRLPLNSGVFHSIEFHQLIPYVPSIVLPEELNLPFHTTYLSVVQRVFGVKRLSLFISAKENPYRLFPLFPDLESLDLSHTPDYVFTSDNSFYNVYRTVRHILSDTSKRKLVTMTKLMWSKVPKDDRFYPWHKNSEH